MTGEDRLAQGARRARDRPERVQQHDLLGPGAEGSRSGEELLVDVLRWPLRARHGHQHVLGEGTLGFDLRRRAVAVTPRDLEGRDGRATSRARQKRLWRVGYGLLSKRTAAGGVGPNNNLQYNRGTKINPNKQPVASVGPAAQKSSSKPAAIFSKWRTCTPHRSRPSPKLSKHPSQPTHVLE